MTCQFQQLDELDELNGSDTSFLTSSLLLEYRRLKTLKNILNMGPVSGTWAHVPHSSCVDLYLCGFVT